MGLTTCFYFIHSLPWRLFIVNNKNYKNKNFLWNNTYSFAKNVVGYIYLYRKCPATGERYRAKEPSPCLFCLLVEEKGRGTMYHAPFCRERGTTMTGSVTREEMRQNVFQHTLTVPRLPWISPSQRVWAKGCAIQAKLTAIAVNLKRIAALITERDGKTGRPAGAFPGLPALLSHYFCSCVLRRSFVLFSLILLDFQ